MNCLDSFFSDPAHPFERFVKNSLRAILGTKIFDRSRRRFRGLGSALMYHRVIDTDTPPAAPPPSLHLAVTKRRFEEQLLFLTKNFNPISLRVACERLAAGKLEQDSVILTFDDGYRDNLTVALPLLEKYSVPATIFITTGFIETKHLPWWYEYEQLVSTAKALEFSWNGNRYSWHLNTPENRYTAMTAIGSMLGQVSSREQSLLLDVIREQSNVQELKNEEFLSWDEIKFLSKHPLIEIGAHTHSHPVLNTLSTEDLSHELQHAREILTNIISKPIDFFTYPYGSRVQVGIREFDAAYRAGYKAALTSRYGHLFGSHRDRMLTLPRLHIDYTDSLFNFQQKLLGIDAMIHFRLQPKAIGY